MSFVMVRMLAQFSRKASVAAGPPCTITFYARWVFGQYARYRIPHALGAKTDQFSGGYFRNDHLGRPAVVKTLEVNEE